LFGFFVAIVGVLPTKVRVGEAHSVLMDVNIATASGARRHLQGARALLMRIRRGHTMRSNSEPPERPLTPRSDAPSSTSLRPSKGISLLLINRDHGRRRDWWSNKSNDTRSGCKNGYKLMKARSLYRASHQQKRSFGSLLAPKRMPMKTLRTSLTGCCAT
jgi:hypothetical protein